jgi:arsenite-transporting ATPase
MILPEDVCTNDFFRNRRQMQMHYLEEVRVRFSLPILQLPLMEGELKGMEVLSVAAERLSK